MSSAPRRVSVYQNNASVVRKFYHNGAVALNFCNPWQKKTSRGKSVEFRCAAPVKLGTKTPVELTTEFFAEADGSALIGVGCFRRFEAFCNGTLCCSTLDDGDLYDAFAPENHPSCSEIMTTIYPFQSLVINRLHSIFHHHIMRFVNFL